MSENLPQLVMFKPTLDDLPKNSLPEGYSLRHYICDDDTAVWDKIVLESFNWAAEFEKVIKADENFKPERVFFVCDGNTPVATATAWYNAQWEKSVGYLHMVGMLPQHAGKGIGLQASLAALHQMKREGRASSVLNTDDFRIPAIKTYIKLGFLPHITHESHEERWEKILTQIGREDFKKYIYKKEYNK